MPFIRVAAFVSLLLMAHVARGQNRWPDERTAGNFVLHADFSLDGYQALLQQMAVLQRDLVRTLGVPPSREAIHLFLFTNKNTYRGYINHYFPNVPYRRALFIKERGPGMVFAYRSDEFEIDVRHESTHALLHGALPMVPLWLDEGLAEYFEMPPDQRAHESPHMTPTLWGVRLRKVPSIDRLENISDLNDMGRSEYRHAWAWVHFLLHESPETQQVLTRYLADINARVPPGRISHRLRARIPNLEDRFVRHFKNWK